MKKYLLLTFIPLLFSCKKENIKLHTDFLDEKMNVTSEYNDSLILHGTQEAIKYTENLIEESKKFNKHKIKKQELCFSQEEINECKLCIYNNSLDCKRYDWVTTYTDKPDFIDYQITNDDYKFIKKYKCSKKSKNSFKNILYTNEGYEIPRIIPAVQPFLNEACNTGWDNLTGIYFNGEFKYFQNLPDYTSDPQDLDKSRFTFIYKVKSPWENEDYMILQVGWKMLPVNDYGNLGAVCLGQQDLQILIYDELTNIWYANNQVVRAGVLCNNQSDCNNSYGIWDIQYMDYVDDYTFMLE